MSSLFDSNEINEVMRRMLVSATNTNMMGGPNMGEICCDLVLVRRPEQNFIEPNLIRDILEFLISMHHISR